MTNQEYANSLTTVDACLTAIENGGMGKQRFVLVQQRLTAIKAVLKDAENQQYKNDNLLANKVGSFDVINDALVEVTDG